MSDSTLLDIYNALFSGETIQMEFPSPREAETFRVKLYKYKKAQDRLLGALELLETPQSLSFRVEKTPPQLPTLETDEVVVTIKLVVLRRQMRTYSFVTVEAANDPLEIPGEPK